MKPLRRKAVIKWSERSSSERTLTIIREPLETRMWVANVRGFGSYAPKPEPEQITIRGMKVTNVFTNYDGTLRFEMIQAP